MSEAENCYISNGTIIKGNITSKGDLRVDGRIEGKLNTDGKLIVGQLGTVDGELNTNYTEVDGILDIKKIDTITLKLNASAKLTGEIEVRNLIVESGAKVNGTITMKGQG